jgi:hypothetical protein
MNNIHDGCTPQQQLQEQPNQAPEPIQPPYLTRFGERICNECKRPLSGPGRCKCINYDYDYDEEE